MLIGFYLFFGEQILYSLRGQQVDLRNAPRGENEVLTIGYAFAPQGLNPVLFDPLTRSALVDVYQGLVKTDRSLKIEPAIAISWGRLDDLTWEFRLRPDVQFHDGQTVTPRDVVTSIEYALQSDESQLKNLLNTISSVEENGPDMVRIKTMVPDPLLLTKLSVTYIFPERYDDFDKPVGTGPYRLLSRSESTIKLNRFEDYWGALPAFKNVDLLFIPERRDRIKALEDGTIQLLANLPPTAGCSFNSNFKDAEGCSAMKTASISVKSVPSLEVSFLAMNLYNDLFSDKTVRVAIGKSFDRSVFVDLAYGFARPAYQFVSSGVFGFDPDLTAPDFDLASAQADVAKVLGDSFETASVTFDYPQSLESVGQYVREQFRDLGIDVELNPVSDSELQKKILSGESDLYYLGWRSELGDASDFLQAVAHSANPAKGYGQFNGTHYANKKVDQLIEESAKNLDPQTRLEQMQEAMKIIVQDDVMALPLFESETIFAFLNGIQFEPRVDGYVYASEIR
ncbi:MAG TPA: ABC transporter substrate-binding protein [Candidatus Gracilibacteria bacterium]|nr:ABC transporter substrate-binding protein [Candidatus Gracilibacteria bacterium]